MQPAACVACNCDCIEGLPAAVGRRPAAPARQARCNTGSGLISPQLCAALDLCKRWASQRAQQRARYRPGPHKHATVALNFPTHSQGPETDAQLIGWHAAGHPGSSVSYTGTRRQKAERKGTEQIRWLCVNAPVGTVDWKKECTRRRARRPWQPGRAQRSQCGHVRSDQNAQLPQVAASSITAGSSCA